MMDYIIYFLIGILVLFLQFTDYAMSLTKRKLVMHKTSTTWNAAYDQCVADGGQLMKYYSIEDDKALNKLLGDGPSDDFWIGLNSHETSTSSENDFVFADCQSMSTSWSKWDGGFSSEGNKGCVLAKKDTRYWFREKCSISKLFLCEIPEGPCTYETVTANCPTSTADVTQTTINVSTDSECREKCQNEIKNGKHCFAYSRFSNCELYFTTDPYFCDGKTGSNNIHLRRCYSYETSTTSIFSSSDESPNARKCTSYVPPTTTTTTTTTTEPSTTTTQSPTTTTEPSTTTTQSPATTTEPSTTTTQSPTTTTEPSTTTTQPPTTTTEPSTTTTQPPTTTTEPSTTTTQPPSTTTEPSTTTTQPPTTTTQPSTTTTQPPATTTQPPTTSTQPSTTTTQPPTTTRKVSTTPTPTTTSLRSTTSSTTTSSPTTTTSPPTTTTVPATTTTNLLLTTNTTTTSIVMATSSLFQSTQTSQETSAETTLCICDICGKSNMTAIEEKMKQVRNDLKVNNAELSSTRRKKESATDERPSAQNIGYIGVLMIVGIFVALFISDFHKIYTDIKWIFR